jgi:hypothetical protein
MKTLSLISLTIYRLGTAAAASYATVAAAADSLVDAGKVGHCAGAIEFVDHRFVPLALGCFLRHD